MHRGVLLRRAAPVPWGSTIPSCFCGPSAFGSGHSDAGQGRQGCIGARKGKGSCQRRDEMSDGMQVPRGQAQTHRCSLKTASPGAAFARDFSEALPSGWIWLFPPGNHPTTPGILTAQVLPPCPMHPTCPMHPLHILYSPRHPHLPLSTLCIPYIPLHIMHPTHSFASHAPSAPPQMFGNALGHAAWGSWKSPSRGQIRHLPGGTGVAGAAWGQEQGPGGLPRSPPAGFSSDGAQCPSA